MGDSDREQVEATHLNLLDRKLKAFEQERQYYIATLRAQLSHERQPEHDISDDVTKTEKVSCGTLAGTDGAYHFDGKHASLAEVHTSRKASIDRMDHLWRLQCEKGKIKSMMFAERMNDVTHQYEYDALRLYRTLDRHRLVQLLKLTKPHAEDDGAATSAYHSSRRGRRRSTVNGHSRGDRGSGGDRGVGLRSWKGSENSEGNGDGDDEGGYGEVADEDSVPLVVIVDLEKKQRAMTKQVAAKSAEICSLLASNLAIRAERERKAKEQVISLGHKLTTLCNGLGTAEERLGQTVLDLLSLRHHSLLSQRASWEDKEQTQILREQVENETELLQEQVQLERKGLGPKVEYEVEVIAKRLKEQLVLKQTAFCMLKEQHDEADRLYRNREADLRIALTHWSDKHLSLKRRWQLEMQGFRRDIEELAQNVKDSKAKARGGQLSPEARDVLLGRIEGIGRKDGGIMKRLDEIKERMTAAPLP